jgi:hypothetical protein
MLTWLTWGVGSIAVVNVVALIALFAAYAWHHGLKPVREERRVRRRTFERLLAQPIPAACTVSWSSTEPLDSAKT